MKINKRLLPVKAHFFFFMAASGPILPYLTVYGKQLGISEILMGSITAVVPLIFLLAKPFFGFVADYFYERRKLIFMGLISSLSLFYLGLYFIPPVNLELQHFKAGTKMSDIRLCHELGGLQANNSTPLKCNVTCSTGCQILGLKTVDHFCYQKENETCTDTQISTQCLNDCFLQIAHGDNLYSSEFYWFILLMTLAMIAFNVSNSISDAICFDVLGESGDRGYGYQRVWGAIGFGITAFLGGVGMDLWSGGETVGQNYTPAFVLVFIFTCMDLLCCLKLKLPKMAMSQNVLKDLSKVLKNRFISMFLVFATFAGILDGFLIYFMFWFLEDLAKGTNETRFIKMLEGLTVAAETLGGEILFFLLSGKIIEKLGYGHTLSLCFFNYSLRFALISLISNPWWILPVELLMQGPTYALCYSAIVAYANAVSPPGTSATMQGIVAGMDDGFGYALGSLAGGFLYRAVGGRLAFQLFSLLAIVCSITHVILYKAFHGDLYDKHASREYKLPEEASQVTDSISKVTYGINT